jgi:hypothetical protein
VLPAAHWVQRLKTGRFGGSIPSLPTTNAPPLTAHGLVAQAGAARYSDPRLALLLGVAAQYLYRYW